MANDTSKTAKITKKVTLLSSTLTFRHVLVRTITFFAQYVIFWILAHFGAHFIDIV